jgi:hypothetical protein
MKKKKDRRNDITEAQKKKLKSIAMHWTKVAQEKDIRLSGPVVEERDGKLFAVARILSERFQPPWEEPLD